MVSVTPLKNPKPENPKNEYHIGGVPVEFPYKPYGTQLAFMGRVIATLDRAIREGHCHALLESPTGSGKSLSLLCSTLAWQQNYKLKNQYAKLNHSRPDPKATTDPLGHGGGFVPEDEPSSAPIFQSSAPTQSKANDKEQKKKLTPTIYYASRTHSQISQVIREYKKTCYRVPMSVLASRKHYCTNAYLRGKENIDEECKKILKDKHLECPEFKNAHKIKNHPSFQKGGCHEAFDIEDLVKVGQVMKGCSYYAARHMAEDAQLVFCPYSYVINPVIRGAMEVDIKGAILVLDEAHNMEEIARDAGSVDIEEEILHKLQTELEQMCAVDALVYQPLFEMTQDLISWIEQRKPMLTKHDFQHYISSWTGDKALRELQESNISLQAFPVLLECAVKAIKAASDVESEEVHLSGISVVTLEGLFSSLTYFFSRNGSHVFDYQLVLQKNVKRGAGKNVFGDWTYTFSLWCLNPAVVFRDIGDLSLSVILTSGTLAPLSSFSSELGIQFGTSLEAPHIIDVESQVWHAVISTGPGNFPLNGSYKTADSYEFQDTLGKSLEEIFNNVPGGCLVFFPSYKLMDKLCKRWCETGQWSQLNAKKTLFVEPRGGSQEDFESVLRGYYDTIRQGRKPPLKRRKRAKGMDLKPSTVTQNVENSRSEGAAFLAVCRGKVSEGIDFSDDNARVVIIVGIPFSNIHDIQVGLKKKYNDTYKSSKNLLSGNEWYCQQAFRALNQAAGRCIRHRFDYGAIILLDERYRQERNRVYVSKWLRKSIKQYDSFDSSLEGLKSFFIDVKERVGKNMSNVSQDCNTNTDNTLSMNQKNGSPGKKNQKAFKSIQSGQEEIFTSFHASPYGQKFQDDSKFQASTRINKDFDNCTEIIDLECNPQKYSGYPASSMSFSLDDQEISIVKETPPFSLNDPEISTVNKTSCIDCSITTGSPRSFPQDEYSSSAIVEASSCFLDQSLLQSPPSTNHQIAYSIAQNVIAVTPEKNATNTSSSTLEMESSLNLSVSSNTQKRRESIYSPLESKTKSNVNQLLSNFDMSFGHVMDKSLLVSCSLCKNPLGHPQSRQYIMCSLTSLSELGMESLPREILKPLVLSTSIGIPVVLTDILSVHPQLCNRTLEGGSGQGIWCEKVGCVLETIFCPFCKISNNCIGLQVVATNASNVHLLNKILLYSDQLEVKNVEASVDKDFKEDLKNFPKQQNSGGWRTTKTKLRLPKRGLSGNTEAD